MARDAGFFSWHLFLFWFYTAIEFWHHTWALSFFFFFFNLPLVFWEDSFSAKKRDFFYSWEQDFCLFSLQLDTFCQQLTPLLWWYCAFLAVIFLVYTTICTFFSSVYTVHVSMCRRRGDKKERETREDVGWNKNREKATCMAVQHIWTQGTIDLYAVCTHPYSQLKMVLIKCHLSNSHVASYGPVANLHLGMSP